MDELRNWLAFYTVPHCGSVTALKLLEIFSTPCAILSAPCEALRIAGASESLIKQLKNPDWSKVDAALCWLEKPGRHILHWRDIRYPFLLREIDSPPLILFVVGDVAILQHRSLAIVGTRQPTATGAEIAYQLAEELAGQGLVITSGLARGIDGAAHRGALAAKGKTIAVLGAGFNRIYPACHRDLAKAIYEEGSVLVSEFFPDSPPKAAHFPRRNRIISGLGLGVMVIEAAIRSGSLITAGYALEQGREVMVVPGSIRSSLSRGCHALLKQGAALIECYEDVLQVLAFPCQSERLSEESEPANTLSRLDSKDRKLVECLGFEVTTIDTLVARTGFSVNRLLACLSQLELQGYISVVPGGYVRK